MSSSRHELSLWRAVKPEHYKGCRFKDIVKIQCVCVYIYIYITYVQIEASAHMHVCICSCFMSIQGNHIIRSAKEVGPMVL